MNFMDCFFIIFFFLSFVHSLFLIQFNYLSLSLLLFPFLPVALLLSLSLSTLRASRPSPWHRLGQPKLLDRRHGGWPRGYLPLAGRHEGQDGNTVLGHPPRGPGTQRREPGDVCVYGSEQVPVLGWCTLHWHFLGDLRGAGNGILILCKLLYK